MVNFYDNFGLISATPDGAIGENNILYSVENYFLKPSQEKKDLLIQRINEMRMGPGLFRQHPSIDGLSGEDLQMSRDQLIAIFAFSKKEGLEFHAEIWKEVKRQHLCYNNVMPNKIQLLQPADLIFFGLCAGGFIWKLFLPLIWLIMLQSTLTKYKVRPEWWNRLIMTIKRQPYTKVKMIATDGKLLTWVRCHALPNELIYDIHNFIIIKMFGSWHKVFEIFFPHPEHPNNKDSL